MQIKSEETNGIEPIENSVIDGKPSDDLMELQLIAKKRKLEEETYQINQSLCVMSAKKNEEKIKQPREDALKRQKLAPEVQAEKLVRETGKLFREATQAALQ